MDRGLRLGEQDVDHRVAVEPSRRSQHRLAATVVQAGAEDELPGLAHEARAGERARGLLDVLLFVVTLAEGEELHHLAREILVGCAAPVLRAVEVDHHRRVARDRAQQRGEAAQRVLAQRHVLPVHQARDAHLGLRRDEVVVPEEGHPLGERRRRDDHLPHPPGAQLQCLLRLLPEERLPFGERGLVAARWAQRRGVHRRGRRLGHRGPARRGEEQRGCLGPREPGVRNHLGARRTETGAREEVPGVVGVEASAARHERCRRRREPEEQQQADEPRAQGCAHDAVWRGSHRARCIDQRRRWASCFSIQMCRLAMFWSRARSARSRRERKPSLL